MPRQQNIRIHAFALLLTCSTFAACGDSASDGDITSRMEELVFGDRNVYQLRDQEKEALNAPSLTTDRKLRYKAAAMGNSAGVVRAMVQEWNPETEVCDPEPHYGSGVMSSSSRMVTAHHVIAGLDPDAPSEPIKVGFGGKCLQSVALNCEGVWFPDENSSVGEEENVFLANRLFQLGLRQWARKAKAVQARKELLMWEFVLDDAPSQPFGYNGTNRDVAILKAKSKDFPFDTNHEDNAYYTPHGGFEMNKPAMFFDHVQYGEFETSPPNDSEATSEPTGVYGLHYPEWDSDGDGIVAPVVSNPGYAETEPVSCWDNDTICIEKNGTWVHRPALSYDHCIPTSLDGVSGSSGGALVYPELYGDATKKYSTSTMKAFGVDHACAPEEDPDCGLWETQTGSTMPDDTFQSIFTTSNPDLVTWSDRDIDPSGDGDAFAPEPNQPSGDGTPSCKDETPTNPCLHSETQPNSVWGSPPQDAAIPSVDDDFNTGSERTDLGRYLCDYDYFPTIPDVFRTRAGLAYGFVGTATDALLTEDSAVASLDIICGPWSTASWTDNWRWLYASGRKVDEGNDAAGWFWWGGSLRKLLPLMFERRVNSAGEEEYLRPVSMMMCPPNSYLQGVSIRRDGSGRLLGIESLLCRKPGSSTEIFVSLWGTAAHDGYTMNEVDFPLTQHIGNPGGGSQTKLLSCDQGGAVMGFQSDRSATAPIKEFWLECGDAPPQ